MFYWNTVVLIHFNILRGYFCVTMAELISLTVVIETTFTPRPKRFAIWSCTEKACRLWLELVCVIMAMAE